MIVCQCTVSTVHSSTVHSKYSAVPGCMRSAETLYAFLMTSSSASRFTPRIAYMEGTSALSSSPQARRTFSTGRANLLDTDARTSHAAASLSASSRFAASAAARARMAGLILLSSSLRLSPAPEDILLVSVALSASSAALRARSCSLGLSPK